MKPAKLGTDILAAVVSFYFLWQHQLIPGLAIHFGPPVLASALLVRFGDFAAEKNSAIGRYVAWHMTRTIEIVRFTGDIVMIFGAWLSSTGGDRGRTAHGAGSMGKWAVAAARAAAATVMIRLSLI